MRVLSPGLWCVQVLNTQTFSPCLSFQVLLSFSPPPPLQGAGRGPTEKVSLLQGTPCLILDKMGDKCFSRVRETGAEREAWDEVLCQRDLRQPQFLGKVFAR